MLVLLVSLCNSSTIDFLACMFCVFSLNFDRFTVCTVYFVFLFHVHGDSIVRPVVVRFNAPPTKTTVTPLPQTELALVKDNALSADYGCFFILTDHKSMRSNLTEQSSANFYQNKKALKAEIFETNSN